MQQLGILLKSERMGVAISAGSRIDVPERLGVTTAEGELEQIQFLPGQFQFRKPNDISAANSGIQGAVNEKIGIEPPD